MRRVISLAMVLSLATASAWLGWPTAHAQAQMPGMYPPAYGQPMMMPPPGAYMPQGQPVMQTAYMGQGMAPGGACMTPNSCMAPDGCTAPNGCTAEPQCGGRMGICDRLCDPGACRPLLTFTGEAIALQRSTTRGQSLLVDDTRASLLDAHNFNFPVAYGPKLSAILHNPCEIGWDLEVAYFQVDGFNAETFVPGDSRIVGDATTSAPVTDATVSYKSALYNGELNVRQQYCDWLTLFCGYRMVQLNEQYLAYGEGMTNNGPTAIIVTANASNHLHGFQLGADAEFYNMGGPLTMNAICKAGIFQNYTSQTVSQVQEGQDSLGSVRDHAAFLGEVGIVARYAFTKRLALRASYEAMWLEGVALAPEQLGATNFGIIGDRSVFVDVSGGVFYHGGSLGAEYRF